MSSPSLSIRRTAPEQPWNSVSSQVTVGKDILELLSTAMYVDPMAVYREYVQNAADAIDEARAAGVLADGTPGRVEVSIDTEKRIVRLRDNGIGVPSAEFIARLTAFGASHKRGQSARGFRGVGRLAGIGYCQELLFRSRASGEDVVSELRWDCRQLKISLRSEDHHKHLRDVVLETVTARHLSATAVPKHFFEVELRGIIRHKNDQLLDSAAINEYLAQVGPVPFAPEFRYREEISGVLQSLVKLGEIEITLPGMKTPVYRPHRNHIEFGGEIKDTFNELEVISIPGMEGNIAAVGWVLHHGYTGALPIKTLQKGLRLRVGNIQIGDDRLLENLFAEPRFNSWSVGEIHILDSRIVPNGRRDQFEQSTHYLNVLTHLTPIARELSKRCRNSSMQRNRWREFLRQVETARGTLAVIRQDALGKSEQGRLLREVHAATDNAERLAGDELLLLSQAAQAAHELQTLRREIAKATGERHATPPLAHLSKTKQQAYQHIFSLIYECAHNRAAAKAIVDRILARL